MCIFSQINNTEREKQINLEKIEFKIDSFSIITNSFKMLNKDNTIIPDSLYFLNEIDALIKFSDSNLLGERVTLKYNVFPVLLSKSYYNRKLHFIEPKDNNTYWERNNSSENKKYNSSLVREGNITRSIMIGNSQDFSMLSNIDLRISGKLSDNVKIQSVISDNNLPFQEDGSSYKLQEFDKVFIRIFNKSNEIITGDIFTKNNNRFVKYKRKAKGVIFNNTRELEKFTYSNSSSFSMSKGKYSNNSFKGTEGNQGPYKLRGRNGENYIVVLSGTEKVFMDGEKLERGRDKDYIIDYNTAEIIFTNNTLITKDKRFYVEFEYNDRSYAQSVVTSNQKFVNKKGVISINLYSEKDWKNQNYLTELSDADKQILSESGDSENGVFSSSVDSTLYSEEKILYKNRDTIINGIEFQFYQFSNNPDSAFYQLRFSEVGQNEGHYILSEEGVNGKIYNWTPPIFINGAIIPQGNFTPHIRILSPKSKTLISSEAVYNLSDRIEIHSNTTFQNYDQNLFSELEDSDNSSFATYLCLKYKIINTEKWKLISENSVEFIDERYEGINKFNEIEFERNWNINNLTGDRILQDYRVSLLKNNTDFLKYQFQILNISNNYSGYKNSFQLDYTIKNLSLKSDGNLSSVNPNNYASSLLFFNTSINYNSENFHSFLTLNIENIENRNSIGNLLNNSSAFTQLHVGMARGRWGVEWIKRKDSKQTDFSNSNQLNFNFKLDKSNNLKFNSSVIYRNLNYVTDSITDENNLLSSNILKLYFWDKFLSFDSRYELGKGKQAKKEKSFIKVPMGMGTHNWIDNNNNGIQELNEFVIAIFQDEAEYVTLLLPSTQLENIFILNYQQDISIDVKKISNYKLLKRIYFNNNLQIQSKNKMFNMNPFSEFNTDNSLNFLTQNIYSVFYNKNNKTFNIHFSNKNSIVQNSFSYGVDQQKVKENKLICSFYLWGEIQNKIKLSIGEKENTSNFFENKNYIYSFKKIEENLLFDINNIHFFLNYIRQNKQIFNEDRSVLSEEISAGYKSKNTNNSNLQYFVKLINIHSDLSNNTILNYELLEGLTDGVNVVWGISLQKKLKNNLQINTKYEGRKSKESKTKHVANLGITAYF